MFEWVKKTVYLDRKVKNIRQVGKKHYLTTKTNVDNKNEQFSEENGCLFVFYTSSALSSASS